MSQTWTVGWRINKLLNASTNRSIDPKQLRQYKWENWYLKFIFKKKHLCTCPAVYANSFLMLKYCLAHEQKHFILTEGAWIESLRNSDRTGFNQLIRLLQSMSGWCPPSSCNKESHEHWPATNTSFPVMLWNRVRVFGTQAFADATHVGRSSSEIAQMLHFWDTCDAFCSEMLTGSHGTKAAGSTVVALDVTFHPVQGRAPGTMQRGWILAIHVGIWCFRTFLCDACGSITRCLSSIVPSP